MEAAVPRERIEEFEAAARRPPRERLGWAFVRFWKPVLDDAPYRSFETMADRRKWCEESLPSRRGHWPDPQAEAIAAAFGRRGVR